MRGEIKLERLLKLIMNNILTRKNIRKYEELEQEIRFGVQKKE